MKIKFIKNAIYFVPVFLGLSMIFVLTLTGRNSYGATIFESEQDYKLKFVDSTDYLTLSESSTVILPFDIISAEETAEGIFVETHENAIIYSPLDCEVISYDINLRELKLKVDSVKIKIKGLISGVKTGDKVACGQIIGTVDGASCIVEVMWGNKRLSLQELKAVL